MTTSFIRTVEGWVALNPDPTGEPRMDFRTGATRTVTPDARMNAIQP
jgi:hypothetical protein